MSVSCNLLCCHLKSEVRVDWLLTMLMTHLHCHWPIMFISRCHHSIVGTAVYIAAYVLQLPDVRWNVIEIHNTWKGNRMHGLYVRFRTFIIGTRGFAARLDPIYTRLYRDARSIGLPTLYTSYTIYSVRPPASRLWTLHDKTIRDILYNYTLSQKRPPFSYDCSFYECWPTL